jgi:hypothetical protein
MAGREVVGVDKIGSTCVRDRSVLSRLPGAEQWQPVERTRTSPARVDQAGLDADQLDPVGCLAGLRPLL